MASYPDGEGKSTGCCKRSSVRDGQKNTAKRSSTCFSSSLAKSLTSCIAHGPPAPLKVTVLAVGHLLQTRYTAADTPPESGASRAGAELALSQGPMGGATQQRSWPFHCPPWRTTGGAHQDSA